VFTGEGAMLRMIAYGNELNLAHPPRPADPKLPWEPVWAAKIRVKSVTMAMLGVDAASVPARDSNATDAAKPPGKEADSKLPSLPGVTDALKGLFGR
jgi:hypothetical protein